MIHNRLQMFYNSLHFSRNLYLLTKKRTEMIYLNNVTHLQSIHLPLYSKVQGNQYELSVKRTTMTNGKYITIQTTFQSADRLFVVLGINLPEELADGEYEYRLRNGGKIVGGGIITITGAVYADIQREQNITYREYESNRI